MKRSMLVLVLAMLGLSPAVIADDDAGRSAAAVEPRRHEEADTPNIRGIYVVGGTETLTDLEATALAAALDLPGVDGLVLVVGWDAVEPTRGHFAWEQTDQNPLDKWMRMAISRGKKVELNIVAFRTPEWLFQSEPGFTPALRLDFIYPRSTDCATHREEIIAAPWDPAFLSEWDAMLAAVARHLKGTRVYDAVHHEYIAAYEAIPILRLTGINLDSDELHLPSYQLPPDQLPPNPKTVACTDAVDIWLNVAKPAYRPSRLLDAWDAITSSFKRSFHDKYFSVAIIDSTHPFPPIDDHGHIITDLQGLSPIQNLPMLELVREKFPGRLVIQNNSLYANEPARSETIAFAQGLKTLIAFQTNEDADYPDTGPPNVVGKGASCGKRGADSPTFCTLAANDGPVFLNMLEMGIFPLGKDHCLRAQYIEVFVPNVNAFPDETELAHAELTTPRCPDDHDIQPSQ